MRRDRILNAIQLRIRRAIRQLEFLERELGIGSMMIEDERQLLANLRNDEVLGRSWTTLSSARQIEFFQRVQRELVDADALMQERERGGVRFVPVSSRAANADGLVVGREPLEPGTSIVPGLTGRTPRWIQRRRTGIQGRGAWGRREATGRSLGRGRQGGTE